MNKIEIFLKIVENFSVYKINIWFISNFLKYNDTTLPKNFTAAHTKIPKIAQILPIFAIISRLFDTKKATLWP